MPLTLTRQGVRNLNAIGPRPTRRPPIHESPCMPETEWTSKGRGRYVRNCRLCGRIMEEKDERKR